MNTNSCEIEILLVEDNDDDAALAIRALKKKNLCNNLIHLKDGAQALNFIFSTGEYAGNNIQTPKVILLDLKMPKVDGIEVLEKLRADARTRHIPVVIMTSSAEDPDIKRAYEHGVNSYIVKPVDFDSFIDVVTSLGFYWLVVNRTS